MTDRIGLNERRVLYAKEQMTTGFAEYWKLLPFMASDEDKSEMMQAMTDFVARITPATWRAVAAARDTDRRTPSTLQARLDTFWTEYDEATEAVKFVAMVRP